MRTPLVEAQIADQARRTGCPRSAVLDDVMLERQAVKRLLEPAEVADLVAYLLGPRAAASPASPVPIDLGWTAA